MFKILSFIEFYKKHKPERTVYISSYNPRSVCINSGFILDSYFANCESLAILYVNGDEKIGASIHCDPGVNELLRESKDLTLRYPKLRFARDVALFWNKQNSSNVSQLISGVKNIFRDAQIKQIPYQGYLDAYGLYVDEEILVLP